MKSYKFTDYTYLEIKDFVDAGCLAIVPTGCTEQQGPHLPVDFDTWFAETAALTAAKHAERCYQVRALVLPAMPFGPTPEHKEYGSGYVNFPHSFHEEYVYFVLVSLAEHGFRAIVFCRGCGEHRLQGVVDRFNAKFRSQCVAYLPSLPYRDIWLRVGDPAVPCATPTALRPQSPCINVRRLSDSTKFLHPTPVTWTGIIHISISRNTRNLVSSVTRLKRALSWDAGYGMRSY